MLTGKELDFLNPKTKVQVVRQKRETDVNFSEEIFMGYLSDGTRYIYAPVLNKPFGLCDTNPKKCAFMTHSPIIAIFLYDQGWIVVTDAEESYMIMTVDRGLPQ
jgi:hypothetical protein